MTNLEFYKDELMRKYLSADRFAYELTDFINEHKGKVNTTYDCIKWLCAEYKEPIKLKQWEYDLLYEINTTDFRSVYVLVKLKEKGYFKGIPDTTMNIKDILDNCEVVDDD